MTPALIKTAAARYAITRSARTKWTILLLIISPVLAADTIYKTIDEHGKVTYSTAPPADTENSTVVDIAPPPSEDDIEAAQKRHEKILKTAEQLDQDRQVRNQLSEEENRKKRERQEQIRIQQQAEKNNSNDEYHYPYIPGRRPLPGRPPIIPPERPVTLPIGQ